VRVRDRRCATARIEELFGRAKTALYVAARALGARGAVLVELAVHEDHRQVMRELRAPRIPRHVRRALLRLWVACDVRYEGGGRPATQLPMNVLRITAVLSKEGGRVARKEGKTQRREGESKHAKACCGVAEGRACAREPVP